MHASNPSTERFPLSPAWTCIADEGTRRFARLILASHYAATLEEYGIRGVGPGSDWIDAPAVANPAPWIACRAIEVAERARCRWRPKLEDEHATIAADVATDYSTSLPEEPETLAAWADAEGTPELEAWRALARGEDAGRHATLRALDLFGCALEDGQGAEAAYKLLEGREGHGIEVAGNVGADVRYVNAGDTYAETLVSVDGEPWHWGCWGDAVEAAEQAYAEETGEKRCGSCGEWSDTVERIDGRSYSGPACESCAREQGLEFVDEEGSARE